MEDFYLFRYELHSMLNKHLYMEEDKKEQELFLLGKRPLSKVEGVPVKDMLSRLKKAQEDEKKNNML